ncbi:hypothetical protein GCM10010430_22100 [Kitasatospora cystarginea]|uniref:Uncharacterized protein n=1 Tax=Kitasatospora cystarginea TaxID=58350 RepID=A0ABN3DRW8_9ACTN
MCGGSHATCEQSPPALPLMTGHRTLTCAPVRSLLCMAPSRYLSGRAVRPYLNRSGVSQRVNGKPFLAPGVASVPA